MSCVDIMGMYCNQWSKHRGDGDAALSELGI